MPRYFQHIRDGAVLIADPDSDDVPDEAAALALARETVAEIRSRPEAFGSIRWLRRVIEVTDQFGCVVGRFASPIESIAWRARGHVETALKFRTAWTTGSQAPYLSNRFQTDPGASG